MIDFVPTARPRSTAPDTRQLGSSLRVATLAAAVAILTAACGSGGTDTSGAATTTTAAPVPIEVSPVATALLDPGAEPRRVVAVAPRPDAEQKVTLVTESKIVQTIASAPAQDFSSPPLTMPLTATSSSAGDGAHTVELTLGALSTPDGSLQSQLGPTENSAASLTVAPTGAVTAFTITPPTEASDVARSAVEQALNQAVYRAVTFPTDAIGVGARWTITQEISSAIVLRQVTTATLRSLEGSVAVVDVAVTQTPDNPVWVLPDRQGTLNIVSYSMTGNGTYTLDLAAPLPTAGTLTVGGDQLYKDANSNTELRQNTTTSLTWQP